DLADASDAALAAAAERTAAMTRLAEAVAAALPRLAQAEAERERATAALAARDAQIDQLTSVRPPARVAARAGAAAAARTARQEAAAAVAAAEDREEKLRGELAAGQDATALRDLLAAHDERAALVAQRDQLAGAVRAAQAERDAAAKALAAARRESERADAALEAARTAYAEAQAADAAAALRAHLVAGEPCPVCAQPVATVPSLRQESAVAQAKAAGTEARRAADAARARLSERDQLLRTLDQTLTASRTQLDLLTARDRELDAKLAGAPGPEAVRAELAGLAALERDLAAAG